MQGLAFQNRGKRLSLLVLVTIQILLDQGESAIHACQTSPRSPRQSLMTRILQSSICPLLLLGMKHSHIIVGCAKRLMLRMILNGKTVFRMTALRMKSLVEYCRQSKTVGLSISRQIPRAAKSMFLLSVASQIQNEKVFMGRILDLRGRVLKQLSVLEGTDGQERRLVQKDIVHATHRLPHTHQDPTAPKTGGLSTPKSTIDWIWRPVSPTILTQPILPIVRLQMIVDTE